MSTNTSSNSRVTRGTDKKSPSIINQETIRSPLSPRVKGNGGLPSVTLNMITDIQSRVNDISKWMEKMDLTQTKIMEEICNLKQLLPSRTLDQDQHLPANHVLTQIQEVHDNLLADKRQKKLVENCHKIKNKFVMKWKQSLNHRKQQFFHCIRNREKADLYTSWSTESPDFLPEHLRPKIRSNEREDVINTKVNEAKLIYNNKITVMKNTAEINKAKYTTVDEDMLKLIDDSTPDEESRSLIQSWWVQDCTKQEDFSHEVWQKRKEFLVSQKTQAIENGTNVLTKIIDTLPPNERKDTGPNASRNYDRRKRNGSANIPQRRDDVSQQQPEGPSTPQQQPTTPEPNTQHRTTGTNQSRRNNPRRQQSNGTRSRGGSPSPQQRNSNTQRPAQNRGQNWQNQTNSPSYTASFNATPAPTIPMGNHNYSSSPLSPTVNQIAPFLANLLQQATHPPGVHWTGGRRL